MLQIELYFSFHFLSNDFFFDEKTCTESENEYFFSRETFVQMIHPFSHSFPLPFFFSSTLRPIYLYILLFASRHVNWKMIGFILIQNRLASYQYIFCRFRSKATPIQCYWYYFIFHQFLNDIECVLFCLVSLIKVLRDTP